MAETEVIALLLSGGGYRHKRIAQLTRVPDAHVTLAALKARDIVTKREGRWFLSAHGRELGLLNMPCALDEGPPASPVRDACKHRYERSQRCSGCGSVPPLEPFEGPPEPPRELPPPGPRVAPMRPQRLSLGLLGVLAIALSADTKGPFE
ncbi:MAG: hypothetical protein HOW73_43450 [Polyangiaceae bacterium]|nr:hypothetical protein [Polyangiaceae bacterium]